MSNGLLTYTQDSNTQLADGLYIGVSSEFNFYSDSRPFASNFITSDVSSSWDGEEFTIYQKAWEVYKFEIIANESQMLDLLKLKTSKTVSFTYVSDSKTLDADTTKADYFNISISNIEKTTAFHIIIEFRVLVYEINHFKDVTTDYTLILNNKDIRTNLFKNVSDFESDFGKYKRIDIQLDVLTEISDKDKDSIILNYIDLDSRITVKDIINSKLILNNTDKNTIKKYLNLFNNCYIENKSSDYVYSLYTAQPATVSKILTLNASADLTKFFEGQTIQLKNSNIEVEAIIVSINSDTEFELNIDVDGLGIDLNINILEDYKLTEIIKTESKQVANDLYELEISANYNSNTNYNLT